MPASAAPVAVHGPAAARPRRAVALLVVLLTLLAGASTARAGGATSAPDRASAAVLAAVRAQLGDPYLWGGAGPDRWDCSGLTSLWRTVGAATGMPRTSREQQAWAVPIPVQQARPGDLVFFGHPVSHVGLVTGPGRMVDAAASRGVVVERAIWASGVVRYGRVPRRGMPPVTPWTPPALPPAAPVGTVADAPVSPARSTRPPAPAPRRTPAAAARPAPAAARPAPSGLAPLAGLAPRQSRPSSAVARRAAALARAEAGRTTWTDVSLVRSVWQRAGGGVLPAGRDALVARGRRVALADARVGDLVVYNAPATHLGVHLGGGLMADFSPRQGKVLVRPVYSTPSVRLVRLG